MLLHRPGHEAGRAPFLFMLLCAGPWKGVPHCLPYSPPSRSAHWHGSAYQESKGNPYGFSFSPAPLFLKNRRAGRPLSSYTRLVRAISSTTPASKPLFSPKPPHILKSLRSVLSQESLLLYHTVLWPFWREIKCGANSLILLRL